MDSETIFWPQVSKFIFGESRIYAAELRCQENKELLSEKAYVLKVNFSVFIKTKGFGFEIKTDSFV